MSSMVNAAPSSALSAEVSELVQSVVSRFKRSQRHDRESGFDDSLWQEIVELGLTRIGVNEDKGGSGGTIRDAMSAAFELSAGGCGVPYVETVISVGLLAHAGIDVPDGAIALAMGGNFVGSSSVDGTLAIRGACQAVGWASVSTHIVGFADTTEGVAIFVVDAAEATVTPGTTLAGEPSDDVELNGSTPKGFALLEDASDLKTGARVRLALARSVQIAGAAHRVLDMCVEHASTRMQFGRPIGKFQAVQHHLAVIAEECELALIAVVTAIEALEQLTSPEFAAAVAKIIAGEAATAVAARAHQVHGAIGLTMEYELQRLTRRMWSWRDDAGSESDWSEVVGNAVLEQGHSGLWALLTSIDQAA